MATKVDPIRETFHIHGHCIHRLTAQIPGEKWTVSFVVTTEGSLETLLTTETYGEAQRFAKAAYSVQYALQNCSDPQVVAKAIGDSISSVLKQKAQDKASDEKAKRDKE